MAVTAEFDINNLMHPFYSSKYPDWEKWRICFEGGQRFLQRYLETFTSTEDGDDFQIRKRISYPPSFSKAAIIEVKNSIYQRMSDITREGGSNSYIEAVAGRQNGVDLLGSSMNAFLGTETLPELLVMGRVGIYVDMPIKQGETIADNINNRPYLYSYPAEDLRSWDYDERPNSNQFRSILLREVYYKNDDTLRLPSQEETRYRFYFIDNDKVYVQFYNANSELIGPDNELSNEPVLLNITRIPFILLEINDSLLTDIADYQIALLNLGSSDMSYCFKANFPFYTEQFDPRFENPYIRQNMILSGQDTNLEGNPVVPSNQEINVGAATGRRYPLGAKAPAFIHPSSEPLKASMEKQEQLKREIRLLINLAITNIQPKMASAESKGFDERTLESGLSYIGLNLEDAERRVAEIWAEYENNKVPATINYPKKYSLKTDSERLSEATQLKSLMPVVPSVSYKRAVAKRIISIMVGDKVSIEELKQMYKEVDEAPVIDVMPELISQDIQNGLVDPETASKARGYPDGSVEKAKVAQAERIARIQQAQTPINIAARGNPDQSVDPSMESRLEKQNSQITNDGQIINNDRGKGK